MTVGLGFVQLVRDIESRLVEALGLGPHTIPADLGRIDGVFRDKPAALEARAYGGGSARYARFVELSSGDLEIGNILIVPRPELPLPVLGVDLVSLGRETAVVVADLSPVTLDGERRELERAVLERHRASSPSLSEQQSELPGWASTWFSSGALCARVPVERAREAATAVGDFVTAFLELERECPSDPGGGERVSARQHEYCAAHRAEDRGLLLLRRIFQPQRADRFLREVLFPERLPT